jgi:carboxypeptidase T
MKKLLFSFFFFCFFCAAFSQQETYYRVEIQLEENTLQTLGQLGVPVEGHVRKGVSLTTEIPYSTLVLLQNEGIEYKILIQDVAGYYVNQNQNVPDKSIRNNCNNQTDYPVPQNFKLGSMAGYFTLSEIYNELDSMRSLFPTLVSQKQQIGTFTSHQGRPVYFVKLSVNPDVNENEPKVYYQALVHAREPMGMQQLFFFMWYLLENYNSNAEIQYLLNNAELYFVPCANPDGYFHNQTTNPAGGGMWRKNRRNNGTSYGVDLNRNFGYQWGYDNTGSSPDPTTDTYRGPSAFSEPETQAVKWLCETIQPLLLLDYHTYSDVLLYPWGYINQKCPDSTLYSTYSSYLTSENNFAYGTAFETIGYNANGGSFDWYYGEVSTKDKIIGWGPEAGDPSDGFWPAQSRIEEISKNYVAMNMFAARFALKYADIVDKTDKYLFGLQQFFTFDIKQLGLDTNGSFTVSILPIQNIVSTGSPLVFSNMGLLENRTDSFALELNPLISPGDSVVWAVQINNGHFSRFDTIHKIYGQAVVLFAENGASTSQWNTSGPWGTTTSKFVSAPSSITDSPFGNYTDNTTNQITMLNNVDLGGAIDARLRFYASWEIEKGYDYVQLFISDDNGVSWTPLCGKYTVNGTANQDPGQPLYDGVMSNWVDEEISLNDWIGQEVKFRFRLKSDWWSNADGFYFDDFVVEAVMASSTQAVNDMDNGVSIFPNPTKDKLFVNSNTNVVYLEIFDTAGKLILSTEEIQQGIDVSQLQNGLYFVHVNFGEYNLVKKLIIQK